VVILLRDPGTNVARAKGLANSKKLLKRKSIIECRPTIRPCRTHGRLVWIHLARPATRAERSRQGHMLLHLLVRVTRQERSDARGGGGAGPRPKHMSSPRLPSASCYSLPSPGGGFTTPPVQRKQTSHRAEELPSCQPYRQHQR
jgi:hypothetical protein